MDAETAVARGLEKYRWLVQRSSWIAVAAFLLSLGSLLGSFFFLATLASLPWLKYLGLIFIPIGFWLCRKEIRFNPWPLAEAAALFEERKEIKARASTYASLIGSTDVQDLRKRRLIADQLAPLVTESAIHEAAPNVLGPRLTWLSRIGPAAFLLAWGVTFFWTQKQISEPIIRITQLIQDHPDLPEAVKTELKKLEDLYQAGPSVSQSEISAALERSAEAIENAERELQEESTARAASSVEVPKNAIRTTPVQTPPQAQPTSTPTATPSPIPSPATRPSPKTDPPPKDTDVQNSKQDSGGQKPSDKKDSKEGDGDGEGSGGDGAGKTGQGEGKQGGDQSSGSGSGESKGKGSKEGKGSGGSGEGSSKSEEKDGAGGSGEDSGGSQEKGGKNEGISEAKKLVQELKKQQGRDGESSKSGGEAPDPKAGAEGAKGKEGQSKSTQGDKGTDGDDSSGKASDKKESPGSEQTGQKPPDQSGKQGEKQHQDGKAAGGDSAGKQPQDSKPQDPNNKPGLGNPGKGENPSRPDPKAKKQPGAGEGKGADGLKGDRGYKDVEVKEKTENVDTRFTSEEENRVKNSKPAGSRRVIEDLKLDRPKNDPERGEQLVPPEYRGLLGE